MRLIVWTLVFIAWVAFQVVFVLLTGMQNTFDYVVWIFGLVSNLGFGGIIGALWVEKLL